MHGFAVDQGQHRGQWFTSPHFVVDRDLPTIDLVLTEQGVGTATVAADAAFAECDPPIVDAPA